MNDANYQFTQETESNHEFEMFNQYPYDLGIMDLTAAEIDSIVSEKHQPQFGNSSVGNLNYSTSLGSLSTTSSPPGYYSAGNASSETRNSTSPPFQHDFSGGENYNSGATFQPGAYFRSTSIKRPNPITSNPGSHYSNSLSPPDSAASTSSWHGQQQQQQVYPPPMPSSNDLAENEMIARMIAEAHRFQSDSIPAAIDLKRSLGQAYTNPQYTANSPMFNPTFSNFPNLENSQYPMGDLTGMDPKRRRTSGPTEAIPLRPIRASYSPTNLLPHQQAQLNLNKDGNPFQFNVVRPDTGLAGNGRTTALNLISNAGLQDRTAYRDDSSEDCKPRNATALRPVSDNVDYAPTKPKVAEKKGKKTEKKKKGEKGHNAVERRYRNNINNHIATLRDIVPALRHLKPLPSMPASRRRASQFTLSTASQAPTPAGLIDGVLAAKTLSKGTILGKSIEYIQYLQYARHYSGEDLEMLMGIVQEFVGGSEILLETFEKRRVVREVQREKDRIAVRVEQERLDREDDSEGEEDEEEEEESVPKPRGGRGATKKSTVASKAKQASQYYESPPPKFPPSPVSSNDELSISPDALFLPQSRHPAPPQSRILLATFMGVSFAAGGYDWTVNNIVQDPSTKSPRAWAGSLIKKVGVEALLPGSTHGITDAGVKTGLIFAGLAFIFASLVFLVLPLLTRKNSSDSLEEMKQKRRNQVLQSLHHLNGLNSTTTYEVEISTAIVAREALLKLVGVPKSYSLIPALTKELLATALCSLTSVRVGGFSNLSQQDRKEVATAWVRILEIEISTGKEFSQLSRCYTAIRVYNLSRSSVWPQSSSTSAASVNSLLALQLSNLGLTTYANSLWNLASIERKKSDSKLQPFVETAISTDFDQALTILAIEREQGAAGEPSDTLPLLRIAEFRCEAALKESWAKIFVAVISSTSAKEGNSWENTVDKNLLEETFEQVLSSTLPGSTLNQLARITKSVLYFDGSLNSLQNLSTNPLILNPNSSVAILAATTIRYLQIRRDSYGLKIANPTIHAESLKIRRLLANSIFDSQDLISEKEVGNSGFDFEMARESCVEVMVGVSRTASGLERSREESDSGVDV